MIHAVGHQVDNLLGSVHNARLLHGVVPIAEALHDLYKLGGQRAAGQLHRPLQLAGLGNGHDPGDQRHINALNGAHLPKIVKHRIVKEHLGGQEVHAAVHLLL